MPTTPPPRIDGRRVRGHVSKAALLDHLSLLDRGGHLRLKSDDPKPSSPGAHGHADGCHCGGGCDGCQQEQFRRGVAALRSRVQRRKGAAR